MITKAIVEEVKDDGFTIKVRIPIIDAVEGAKNSTSSDLLSEAPICTISNVYNTVNKGDIVFVGFEDNDIGKPIVLGSLSLNKIKVDNSTKADIVARSLDVLGRVTLPENTTIGRITKKEIACLAGVKSGIQFQIDNLKKEIDTLKNK